MYSDRSLCVLPGWHMNVNVNVKNSDVTGTLCADDVLR